MSSDTFQPTRLGSPGDPTKKKPAGHPDPAAASTANQGEEISVVAVSRVRLLPRTCGEYELLEELGSGGMGVVYKAREGPPLNRIVALKMIRHGALAGPGDLRRFEIEAQAAAALDHANIVSIYRAGQIE